MLVGMTYFYLDNNASTPLDSEVALAMQKWNNVYGNPHAGHFLGSIARVAIGNARNQVLSTFGVSSSSWTCIFTSGASESNNLIVKGLVFKKVRSPNSPERVRLVASRVEHSSIDKCLSYVQDLFGREKVIVDLIPVDNDGVIMIDEAREIMTSGPKVQLVTCIHTVAETGAVEPIPQLASIVKEMSRDTLIHCDASQSVGKLDQSILHAMAECVDFITVAGHKFGGPKGSGALLCRTECLDGIDPLIHGAGQEYGLRGGTENVASIVGLGKACEVAYSRPQADFSAADVLWETISSELSRQNDRIEFRRNSTAPVRSNYTLNLSVAGMDGPKMVSELGNDNMYGIKICFSAGSACHSRGCPSPSKVLAAMGLDGKFTTSGIRLSIGPSTTKEEIVKAGLLVAHHITKSIL